MKYTKKQRDEAILICAIAASTPEAWNYLTVQHHIDASVQSRGLSWLAWQAVSKLHQSDAEAECLLRDGWSPGDPVEVRR